MLKPGAREQKIVKVDEGSYSVWVKARPVKGQANAELLEFLAEHFKVKKTAVRIVIGRTAREKLIEVVK